MVRLLDKATVLNRVYASNLPSRAKTVMFYLANRSNKELTCFPAIPTIAKETGMSERTVQRALKELCEEGYVEKSHRYRENGGQSSNLYKLKTEENNKADVVNLKAESADKKVSGDKNESPEVASYQQEMQNIKFSFFDTTSYLSKECHRGGVSCVPP